MSQTLKQRIQEDMKSMMRERNQQRLDAIRLILAAVKQKEVDERIDVDDTALLSILDKMSKQRRDSISQFAAAGRQDLVAKEQFELEIIQTYLPTALTDAEIEQIINQAMQQADAKSSKDMGKVMGIVKPHIQGRADTAAVSNKIKQRLTELDN